MVERILNSAKGAIGNDPGMLATIRAAVEDGFNQAAEILGVNLPKSARKLISIIVTFDLWASDGRGESIVAWWKKVPSNKRYRQLLARGR